MQEQKLISTLKTHKQYVYNGSTIPNKGELGLHKLSKIHQLEGDVKLHQNLLLPLLRQYGDRCMSYSTMQPGLQYIIWEKLGYAAWMHVDSFISSNHAVFLSNPVLPERIQAEFIMQIAQRLPKITLVQISERLASQMFELGFRVYQIGVETELDVQSYDLKGKNKASLRQWRNRAIREGVKVEEKPLSVISAETIKKINKSWLKDHGGKELFFLTRPMPRTDEDGVRFFWAEHNERIIGLAGFDPIYKEGKVAGYYHNFDRIESGVVNGTSSYILLSALEKFRSEGIETINLGLSPLVDMVCGYNLSKSLKKISETFSRYGENIYPFKGNARHKSKFCGRRKKVYVASNTRWFDTLAAAVLSCNLRV